MIVRPVLCRSFIGRREELAYLRERRLEAGQSHGGLVLIAGDAGVGKSRLISEFCKSLAYSRWKITGGACLEFASRPYGPILEGLSNLELRRFHLNAAVTKREQLDTLSERFVAVTSKNAVILTVEDLHWADVATLDFLAYLSTKLNRLRMFVVVSVRSDELGRDRALSARLSTIERNARAGRIDLGPLRGPELQHFIDGALDGIELSEEVRRQIALAADGNPFYTEELLKSAVEQARAASGARAAVQLPQSVRATLLERLTPMDESDRRIVAQAALIGRRFDLDLLAATLEMAPSDVIPALRRARDLQLVDEVDANLFRFRHGLTREAIYSEFLKVEVAPQHRAIARALEGVPKERRRLAALAYHWSAARDAAKASTYNELAGDEASAVHAHEDAVAFFERALEFEADPLVRASIVRKIAERRLALGATKEAQANYCAAADLFRDAGDSEREAGCRVTAAITAYGIGVADPTGPLEEMLTRLEEREYVARSRVRLGLAWLLATFAFPTRATRHLEQVDRRALSEFPDISLRFDNVAAFVAMTLGDLDAFAREHALWVAAAEASGSITTTAGAFTNGAMIRAFFGLHEEAQENLDRALALSRQARSRHCEESVHAFAVMCHLLRGDLHHAREELGFVSPASENRVNITFATAFGTIVGAALDDEDLIERWFEGFEAAVLSAPEVECGAGFAEMLVRRGRVKEAATLLGRALPECELIRGNVLTLLAVGRYGAEIDRERARRYLVRASEGPREMPERPALALFDAMACERRGESARARELAAAAAQGFRRLRFPLLEAQALELAGETKAALAIFRRCGAAHDVKRLERGSAPDGAVARTEAAQAAGSLSAREREIAALAASGHSNLEIARLLSITHKTVEKHLGSAYQKLHISSRAQLGAYVEVKAEPK